ncbi:hypothetical protein LXL04_009732 [Taraxacum kok-saghyz]
MSVDKSTPTTQKTYGITNIKSYVPLILDLTSHNYDPWSDLFRAHCILSETIWAIMRERERAVQMRTIIGGGNGGTNLGHLFKFAADQFFDAGALLSAQHMGCLRKARTEDSDSDHGLGPWSVRLIMSVGLGPRTRSDFLRRTRSAQKNRRLRIAL